MQGFKKQHATGKARHYPRSSAAKAPKHKAADTLPSTCCAAKRGSEAYKHSVVKVAQEVVVNEEVVVLGREVRSDYHRHTVQPLGKSTLATWSGSKLHFGVRLSLKFLLVLYEETKVSAVVKNHGVVLCTRESPHPFWEVL